MVTFYNPLLWFNGKLEPVSWGKRSEVHGGTYQT